MLRDQLHGVAVARDQQGVYACLLAPAGKCAQNVVGFKRGAGELAHAHGCQAFAHQVKLRDQLGRSGFAACFVFAVILVAERGAVHVKGDGQVLGPHVVHHLEQHGQEAKNGIGKHAVLIGERRKRMKSAVHQAVAINDDECLCHSGLLDDTDTTMIPQRRRKYKSP